MPSTVAIIAVLAVVLVNSLVMGEDDVTYLRYGFDGDHPGLSCADIHYKNPESHGKSGNYAIKTDHLSFVYCDMELECGGTKGGWMRIADINTSRGDQCPSGWVKSSQHHSCKPTSNAAGCYSTIFDTLSTSYNEVCGKIIGYQKGTMDGFYPSARAHGRFTGTYQPDTASRSLDGVYVDGISVTLGSPRKHLWTYAVGLSDAFNYTPYNCPCAKYPGPDPPSFVHDHYYCESGNNGSSNPNKLYTEDPLWDGAGCPPENSCCYQPSMPWFYRQLPKAENGNIEVRMCRDQHVHVEDVTVEQIELYVQ
ncbi:uncharacterized protein [Dysidea avara]|uniref:uncharacterized protein n=1 Tax=Dysidea avara TaxID=196820 RepID=UPI003322825D